MIFLDGKKLSQKILDEIRNEISKTAAKLRLAAVVVGEDPVIRKFVEQKKKIAESVGMEVRVYPFPAEITTNDLRKRIAEIVHEEKNTGVIIQLPLPEHINKQYILNSVTPEKDVDVLSSRALGNFVTGKSAVFPPVAGAVKAFFEEYKIDYKNKYTIILGAGNLVGRPTALWLLSEYAQFSVVTDKVKDVVEFTRRADIIISGTGKPKFITGDMVKEGVIVIDAGTSESEGKISGDIDFESVSQKASFITPVPGGVGPVTVAILLRNLAFLAKG